MRLEIHAVGRMKSGPERELADRYFERLARSGPSIGFEFGGVTEHAESQAQTAAQRRKDEADRLSAPITAGAIILLDEAGKSLGSAAFAERLGKMRDDGRGTVAFVIGGPDGLDERFRAGAELLLSFGAMTWPHQIARILLAEQLYRAVTILTGHPYHRA